MSATWAVNEGNSLMNVEFRAKRAQHDEERLDDDNDRRSRRRSAPTPTAAARRRAIRSTGMSRR